MIKKYLKKLINWATRESVETKDYAVASPQVLVGGGGTIRSLNFSITSAIGGKIVNVSYYDQAKSHHYEKMYIIHEDLNFADELTHIITMESLSR